MNVLIAYGSRHGATREIASAIARGLERFGVKAEVRDVHTAGSVEPFDAVIIGSAVYMGRWMEEARHFLAANESALRERPTWLFSTGPVGDPPAPAAEALDADAFVERIGARDHRTFSGKLDRHELGLVERLTVSLVHAADGDFRDWAAIEAWAIEIASELRVAPATGAKV